MTIRHAAELLGILLLGGCISTATGPGRSSIDPLERAKQAAKQASSPETTFDIESTEVRWKERIGQGYLFIERHGDYRQLGDSMSILAQAVEAAGNIQVSGSPFVLLYDDPGQVPAADLRGRVCLPVERRPEQESEHLSFDVLPAAMVVYATVNGRAMQATRVLPALLRSMESLGGRPSGPVREVLLPSAGSDGSARTEIQLPWTQAGS